MSTKQKGRGYVLRFFVLSFMLTVERVVDTTPYLLQDRDGERKFNFDLEICLERARESGKTLLKGHFFYLIFTTEIADNVIRTLASAIKSAGGTVRPSSSRVMLELS